MARILIVDDSKIIRRNLSVILNRAGHEIVAEAENGLQAIREYEKNMPDLITMDISMPIMDGVTAVKKIIARHPKAIIIMISAMDQKSMVMAAIKNGARNYIIKPFSPDKVVEVINAMLATVGKAVIAPRPQPLYAPEDKQVLYPFHIEAHKDNIRVTIKRGFAGGHLRLLDDALRGFLAQKALQATFDFSAFQLYEYTLIDQLIEIMQTIKDNGGYLRIVAEDQEIIRYFKSRGVL